MGTKVILYVSLGRLQRDDSPKEKKKPGQEEAAVDDDAEDDAVLQAMDAEEGGELMAE